MYIDGPWAQGRAGGGQHEVHESHGPRSRSRARTARTRRPAFAGGSDLGVWAKTARTRRRPGTWSRSWTARPTRPRSPTRRASSREFTSQLSGGVYTSSPIMAGFAKAAGYTQISPLNAKNWATADATDQIIPTMMKALMQGANFSRHGEPRPTPSCRTCSTRAASPDRLPGRPCATPRGGLPRDQPGPAPAASPALLASCPQPPGGPASGGHRPAPPGRAPGQPSGRPGPAVPSARVRVAAFIRRHKLAPYLLLLPALVGIALVLLWPLVQVGLFSFQNYGLPQLTGAAADPVGGAGQLHHTLPTRSSGCRCAPRCCSRPSSCR